MIDEDPEVRADRELRESSLWDRSRSRISLDGISRARVASAVEQWPCRVAGCKELVDVPEEAINALRVFNDQLARRGERAIATDSVMLCASHYKALHEWLVVKGKERRERLAVNIRKLKASNSPRHERELIDELKRDHHPDIDGLLASLEEKLRAPNKRSRKDGL